jgi:hypothetical protein
MRWDLLALAVSFVAGVAVGAVPWLVLRRREPPAPDADSAKARARLRRHTLKVAAVSAGLTLLVAVAGTYAALRVLLGSTPLGQAGTDQVLREMRAHGGDGGAANAFRAPDRLGPPPAGVYTYAASGYDETTAPVFGAERRELPATVPAALVHTPEGWTLTVHYFDRHRVLHRFVAAPGRVLEEPEIVTDNVRFGMEIRTVLSCRPPEVVRAGLAPGATWPQDCGSVTTGVMGATQTLASVDTFVGTEPLTVGGTKVDAWHVRRETVVANGQTGTLLRDVWFATDTGMMLRFQTSSKTTGIADHDEDIRLELTSLVPQT